MLDIGLTALLSNLGLLTLGAVLLFIVTRQRRLSRVCYTERTLLGAALGLLSVIVMQTSVPGPYGSTIDTRAAPLFLAGYFGGPVGALAASVIGGAARFQIGGPAVYGGVLSVVIYTTVGWQAAAVSERVDWKRCGAIGWAMAAILASVAVLPSFFVFRPLEIGLALVINAWPTVMFGNIAGLLIMGLLFESFHEGPGGGPGRAAPQDKGRAPDSRRQRGARFAAFPTQAPPAADAAAPTAEITWLPATRERSAG
ncbi:LytS/YhcK type 5TM receptor domain-containing protein [Rubrimonas cliftonensis]|uniref:5TMR of 5TMR-LYT n=1 Tax=Rubrimonas cliftonensis TaxID=89524 RepID=A0A1H3ZBQ9_9RHOB|nr:LytS/YhcK type 5TM receptor domain-containing protein [Rubrimonas cliftonensis]SEA21219.1 5TMR of 5TMR-LYT [Rubrimonas cliftonensis]